MNILLTNDDGVNASGIKLLRKKLSKYGNVTIVAPDRAMSGMGVAIIYGRPVKVTKVEEDVFAMDGTPADCVAFGLSSLNRKFDLVVSGCNEGLNICYDVLHSGTFGACLEGLIFRTKAVAFSCDENDFVVVDKYFDQVMAFILNHNLLDTEHALNVNFPTGQIVKKIRLTKLHYREETTFYIKDEGDDMYLALRNVKDDSCEDESTDAYAVHHEIVSITKLNKIF